MPADKQVCFSMPFDGIVRRIEATMLQYTGFDYADRIAVPFVELFTADPHSNAFAAQPSTYTQASESLGYPDYGFAGNVHANEPIHGWKDNIGLALPAGTRVAIAGMCRAQGNVSARDNWFNFSGSIWIEHA
jgi:hypothetical protein